ncbi:MAG: hypothetical protein INR62_11105 [Rhodospirillales bacterium]|nr:hypothetical protein [Acetobacter sp.]
MEHAELDMHAALDGISVGDFVHAVGSQGAKPICLILDKRDGLLFTRSVTTHIYIVFSDQTGEGAEEGQSAIYNINCVQEMPSDVRRILSEIDQKYDPKNRDDLIARKVVALTRECSVETPCCCLG